MKHEGPKLESLLRRLSETPDDYRVEVCASVSLPLPVLVAKLAQGLGRPVPAEVLASFAARADRIDPKQRALVRIVCWFLADPWFQNAAIKPEQLLSFLEIELSELATHAASGHEVFIRDPERREELARFVLARLGFCPRGESAAESRARLASLTRAATKPETRWAEERAHAIHMQLARASARESADKWTRE